MGDSARPKTSIPIVKEQVRVGSQEVVTGRVVLNKKVDEREELIDMPLISENYRVERIPKNLRLDGVPAVRRQGDVTIIPVVEEVAVVTKQMVLREELRITRVRTKVNRSQRVRLKRERIDVSTVPPEPRK
ncbi:MAG TPA: YsnF/AvaK domain-containing protein [Candidatus Binataceae bacterium]|nr:YsnF/AvaK domain-containing protein [Candidatus Binataceae bacterium]